MSDQQQQNQQPSEPHPTQQTTAAASADDVDSSREFDERVIELEEEMCRMEDGIRRYGAPGPIESIEQTRWNAQLAQERIARRQSCQQAAELLGHTTQEGAATASIYEVATLSIDENMEELLDDSIGLDALEEIQAILDHREEVRQLREKIRRVRKEIRQIRRRLNRQTNARKQARQNETNASRAQCANQVCSLASTSRRRIPAQYADDPYCLSFDISIDGGEVYVRSNLYVWPNGFGRLGSSISIDQNGVHFGPQRVPVPFCEPCIYQSAPRSSLRSQLQVTADTDAEAVSQSEGTISSSAPAHEEEESVPEFETKKYPARIPIINVGEGEPSAAQEHILSASAKGKESEKSQKTSENVDTGGLKEVEKAESSEAVDDKEKYEVMK